MSWQEKIERCQTERQQAQEEATRLKNEARLKIAKEKIPPLLEVLNQLPIQEFLTQIRDEVWKLGEIYTFPAEREDPFSYALQSLTKKRSQGKEWKPGEDNYRHVLTLSPSPLLLGVQIALMAEWPAGVAAGGWNNDDSPHWEEGYTIYHGKFILIGAEWGLYVPRDRKFCSRSHFANDVARTEHAPSRYYTGLSYNGREFLKFAEQVQRGEIEVKEKILLYGEAGSWVKAPFWTDKHYGGFSDLLFDDPDVVSKIEEHLIEISASIGEGEYPPPLDRYKMW